MFVQYCKAAMVALGFDKGREGILQCASMIADGTLANL